jgi:ABC-type multidrug transport system ATPase subunit
VIEIRGLCKRFGATVALDDVSASIGPGEFTVLLGSNGAGKTTLLRCLLGLVRFEGTVTIGSCDVATSGHAARRLIGYVPQRPALPPEMSCEEVMDFFARLRGMARGDLAWLERVGLDARAETPTRELSGGQRQRLALALALQADPSVILFDEPAAHLDAQAARALHRDLEDLSVRGRTVVLSTHRVADVIRASSRALLLERGRLAYDGPASTLGPAVQQRVVFSMNGTGRPELRAALGAVPGVQVTDTSGAVIAITPTDRTFDVVAAVAAAGVRPHDVHIDEPTVDSRRLPTRAAEAPR